MKKIALVLAVIFGLGGNVWAQPYTPTLTADVYDSTPDAVATPNDDNDNLAGIPNPTDINDAINLLLGTAYANNEDVDSLRYTLADNDWQDLGSISDPASYALIGLTADNSNSLRVYDVTTPGTKIDVFGASFSGYGFTGDGSLANPFPAAFSPFAPGTNFGWNLASSGSEWDSNPSYNVDGLDHMITYYLPGLAGQTVYIDVAGLGVGAYTFTDPYLIGWEDLGLKGGLLGDEDFDDFIYIVDRVVPVPEPMTMTLLGSGLLGLVGLRRKNKA